MAQGTLVVVGLLTGFAALTAQSLQKMSSRLDERISEYKLRDLSSGVIVVRDSIPAPMMRPPASVPRSVRGPAFRLFPTALHLHRQDAADYNPVTPGRCSLPVPAHRTEEASATLHC